MHAQNFKDERMERMTGKKSMPNVPPMRDPRAAGIRNPASTGEQRTQMENARTNEGGTPGARPGAFQQSQGPGMLNAAQMRGPATANANALSRGNRM